MVVVFDLRKVSTSYIALLHRYLRQEEKYMEMESAIEAVVTDPCADCPVCAPTPGGPLHLISQNNISNGKIEEVSTLPVLQGCCADACNKACHFSAMTRLGDVMEPPRYNTYVPHPHYTNLITKFLLRVSRFLVET